MRFTRTATRFAVRSTTSSTKARRSHSFQRQCNINSNSYSRFIKLKEPYSGTDNQTYEAASIFFKRRELAGIKPSKKKEAKAEDLDKFDVSDPVLKLEDRVEVKIYDICDEVRRKKN